MTSSTEDVGIIFDIIDRSSDFLGLALSQLVILLLRRELGKIKFTIQNKEENEKIFKRSQEL